MKTIYKYELNAGYMGMPKGAQILTIQMQNGFPHIWAIVDTDAITDLKTIVIFGTGEEIPKSFNGKYIGTFQHDTLVWHVFEGISPQMTIR